MSQIIELEASSLKDDLKKFFIEQMRVEKELFSSMGDLYGGKESLDESHKHLADSDFPLAFH